MGGAEASISFNLCADDFALSPGVSRGILEAAAAGRLTAVSVMTTRPSWPEGARLLSRFRGRIDIGLHFNLTLGRPLSAMPKFAPSGQLPGVFQVLKAARRSDLPEAEIRREISRQLDGFCDQFGAAPDFVDGHQHVQVLPHIRRWLFEALEERELSGKVWLRDSGDRFFNILQRRSELKKALGIAWFARGFASEAAARGFSTNAGFSGFSSFDPHANYGAEFAAYLRALGARHLIMCHPGYCDAELAAADSVAASRELELKFLLSSAFPMLLAENRAKLARFGGLGAQGQPIIA
jgi:hypothetical protein